MKSVTPNDGSSHGPANAVLCTESQTYQIRQVHSSNSVFVIQPSNAREASVDGHTSPILLTAIAKCTATLEVLPSSPYARAFLGEILPVYEGLRIIKNTATETNKNQTLPSKSSKLLTSQDLPVSNQEFERAWRVSCAFELDGQSHLPTTAAVLEVWKSILSAALLRNVDMKTEFSFAMIADMVEEDGHPAALVKAVIQRLCADGHACFNDSELAYVLQLRSQT